MLAPNFAYSIMGCLMTISERPTVTRISKLNKKKKYEDKRYSVLKFEFHAIKEAQDNSEMANFN